MGTKRRKNILQYTLFTENKENQGILQGVQTGSRKLLDYDASQSHLLDKSLKLISKIPDKAVADDTFCKACQSVVSNVLVHRKNGANENLMRNFIAKLCNVISDWGPDACEGYLKLQLPTILYIIDNKRNLTPERVCAIYFQDRKCVDPHAKKWIVPIPAPRGVINYEHTSSDPIKILHLTDIHYDPLYVPGSEAVCDLPLCCQGGISNDTKNSAGYWGDYNVCDMPRHSVEDLLQRVKEKHLKDIEFIYFTGDIISHKSWATTRDENTKCIKEVLSLLSEKFGSTPVYPILGNHEPHPGDFFSPVDVTQEQLSVQWILNLSAQEWSRWLPEDTQITIKKGGYYTVLVKPGFRVVALNSNVCYRGNLWLFYEDEDPYHQLAWLAEVLYAAERNKEKVHILSHIPPGEVTCHRQWSNQFRKIVNRFADTISAQFNGHTHTDEWRIFYDQSNETRPVNVAFNGGSFTTFVGYNPNYRIYQVNPRNAVVLNYDQYIFNLTQANKNISSGSPNWYKLYSFKEAYGLPELSLGNLDGLLRKMSGNEELLNQYFRFMVRDSDVKIKEGCNRQCIKQLLCYIAAVETDLSVEC